MNTSDRLSILALLVSTLSFFVSLGTLYLQFLRKSQILKLTLLDFFLESSKDSDSTFLLNLAFANLGNQSIVISKVKLLFSKNNKVEIKNQSDKEETLILEPSDISLECYRFQCPEKLFSFILNQDSSRQELRPAIHVEIIDYKGIKHERYVYGCVIKVENLKAYGTNFPLNAQVYLLS